MKASLFDAKTSQRIEATLHVKPEALEICTSDTSTTYPLDSLRFSQRLGTMPRTIYLPDGRACETNDNDAIDAFLKQHKHHGASRLLHTLESKMRYLLLALAITAAFSYAFIAHGLPAIAKYVAQELPAVLVYSIGSSTLQTLDQSLLKPSELNASRQESLQHALAPYIQKDREWPRVQVVFRSTKLGANAFALPDGTIVFTDDLVKLAHDNRELVGIFFHELGHVENRHALRTVLQDSAFFLLLSAMTGDVSTASGIFSTLPTMLVESSFSRDLEREADDYAYKMMQHYQIDHEYFALIMERLMQSHPDSVDGVNAYLQSHPPTAKRIARFRHLE